MQYTVMGLNKQKYDSYEFEIVPGYKNKILFESDVSVTRKIERERTLLYLHNTLTDTYLELTFEENPIAGHNRTSCIVGNMYITPVMKDFAYENCLYIPEHMTSISEEVIEQMYDEEIEIKCDSPYDVWLYKVSLNGNNEETPHGYSLVNESLFINRNELDNVLFCVD